MKNLLFGLTAIALVGSPVASAKPDNHRGHKNANRDYDERSDNHQHEGRQWHERSGHWDNGRHLGWGPNRGHGHHWSRGQRMGYSDWNDYRQIDYRRYNLRQPQDGYEWRRNDDRFLLVSRATGLIVSVIQSNGR